MKKFAFTVAHIKADNFYFSYTMLKTQLGYRKQYFSGSDCGNGCDVMRYVAY